MTYEEKVKHIECIETTRGVYTNTGRVFYILEFEYNAKLFEFEITPEEIDKVAAKVITTTHPLKRNSLSIKKNGKHYITATYDELSKRVRNEN